MASVIVRSFPLGMPWATFDPFLFCVHHRDAYPVGNGALGPAASLEGRNIGMDFEGLDDWRMYHGDRIPGFPGHPHRGFETITWVRTGYIDHSDSLGASARFGGGDLQWLTAGKGIVHSEMFPLLHDDRDNPLELFQIWLNLPSTDKLAEPHFSMLWNEDIPRIHHTDDAGRAANVTVLAGTLDAVAAPAPPPNSWAATPANDVGLWHVELESGASWTLPAAAGSETTRAIYVFDGPTIALDGTLLGDGYGAVVRCDSDVALSAPEGAVSCLIMQARPIGEPVAQYGPFVMNTQDELRQAFDDYRSTGFGGWPWPDDDPTHGHEEERFALHPDGRRLTPPSI